MLSPEQRSDELMVLRTAIAHYERVAAADSRGEHANNIFSLWGAAVEKDPSQGRRGARRVWEAAGLVHRP